MGERPTKLSIFFFLFVLLFSIFMRLGGSDVSWNCRQTQRSYSCRVDSTIAGCSTCKLARVAGISFWCAPTRILSHSHILSVYLSSAYCSRTNAGRMCCRAVAHSITMTSTSPGSMALSVSVSMTAPCICLYVLVCAFLLFVYWFSFSFAVDVYCDCGGDGGGGNGDCDCGSGRDVSRLMLCCDRFGFRLRLRLQLRQRQRQRSFEFVIAVVISR